MFLIFFRNTFFQQQMFSLLRAAETLRKLSMRKCLESSLGIFLYNEMFRLRAQETTLPQRHFLICWGLEVLV